MSQPSLSAAVKNLEDELGVLIFERGKGEVLVTPIGEEVVAQARRALDEAARVKTVAAQGRNPLEGPLRLGIIHTVAPYLLPELVAALLRSAPRMPLDIEENLTANLDADAAVGGDRRRDRRVAVRRARHHRHRALQREFSRDRAGEASAGRGGGRSGPTSLRRRTCCCSTSATASATRCSMPATSSRGRPCRARRAIRWRPSATWSRPAWAFPCCRRRRLRRSTRCRTSGRSTSRRRRRRAGLSSRAATGFRAGAALAAIAAAIPRLALPIEPARIRAPVL